MSEIKQLKLYQVEYGSPEYGEWCGMLVLAHDKDEVKELTREYAAPWIKVSNIEEIQLDCPKILVRI